MTAEGKTVALVLGAGAARGLAHIGVIREVLERGYEIRSIAGTSMGALVGGIYAMGKLDTYTQWVLGLEQRDILRLIDWTLSGGGLIRGKKVMGKLESLVGNAEIRDFDLDFTAVAVDIDHAREVWLSEGPLFDAIRASIAIPGLFTPHRYLGRTLVDGGLLNPVPVAPTLRNLTDLTIVVDANGPAEAAHPDQPEDAEHEPPNEGTWQKFREFINSFGSDRTPRESRPGLFSVMLRSLEVTQALITRQQLAVFRPDHLISIPKNACMAHEFHRAREMIQLGRDKTRTTLNRASPR